jgi:tRNA threonylcarbamoyladenosine biosynthesis protein TsaE
VHEVETATPEETERVGEALGRAARGGELIGLVGDLGAGKTCLVRGLARGLGIDPERITSPTFIVVAEHRGGRLALQHVDLYRLENWSADEPLLREVLYGDGVAAVEWFDRLGDSVGEEFLRIAIGFGAGERRLILLEASGGRHEALLARVVGALRGDRRRDGAEV